VRLAAALAFSLLVHGAAGWFAARREPTPLPAAAKPATRATRVALFTRAPDRVCRSGARRGALPGVGAQRPGAQRRSPSRPRRIRRAQSSPSTVGTEAGDADPAPSAAAVPAAGPTFDAAALHERLAASARRCYHGRRRRFGLTGEAQLDFCLDAAGAVAMGEARPLERPALLDTARPAVRAQRSAAVPRRGRGRLLTPSRSASDR